MCVGGLPVQSSQAKVLLHCLYLLIQCWSRPCALCNVHCHTRLCCVSNPPKLKVTASLHCLSSFLRPSPPLRYRPTPLCRPTMAMHHQWHHHCFLNGQMTVSSCHRWVGGIIDHIRDVCGKGARVNICVVVWKVRKTCLLLWLRAQILPTKCI